MFLIKHTDTNKINKYEKEKEIDEIIDSLV